MTKLLLCAALVLGFSHFAVADHDSDHGAGPCAKDAQTFCAGVQHGDGRLAKCMKENEAKLSPECKAHHETMKEALKEVKEACHEDAAKFCGDVKHGKGRLMKCMKSHKAELSASCQAEIAEAKAARKSGK